MVFGDDRLHYGSVGMALVGKIVVANGVFVINSQHEESSTNYFLVVWETLLNLETAVLTVAAAEVLNTRIK